jgi:hypothetical protein
MSRSSRGFIVPILLFVVSENHETGSFKFVDIDI